jgi:hypothetical protein
MTVEELIRYATAESSNPPKAIFTGVRTRPAISSVSKSKLAPTVIKRTAVSRFSIMAEGS